MAKYVSISSFILGTILILWLAYKDFSGLLFGTEEEKIESLVQEFSKSGVNNIYTTNGK